MRSGPHFIAMNVLIGNMRIIQLPLDPAASKFPRYVTQGEADDLKITD